MCAFQMDGTHATSAVVDAVLLLSCNLCKTVMFRLTVSLYYYIRLVVIYYIYVRVGISLSHNTIGRWIGGKVAVSEFVFGTQVNCSGIL